MERKENGMSWFDKKIHNEFGIPQIWPLPQLSHKRIPNELSLFINRNTNLIVISCNYYAWCIKFLRLKFIGNMEISMKWITQSEVTPIYDKHISDLVCLVNLHEEQKKGLLGGFINTCISHGSQILIGVSEGKALNEAFPYDLDTLENNFEVLKI